MSVFDETNISKERLENRSNLIKIRELLSCLLKNEINLIFIDEITKKADPVKVLKDKQLQTWHKIIRTSFFKISFIVEHS